LVEEDVCMLTRGFNSYLTHFLIVFIHVPHLIFEIKNTSVELVSIEEALK